MFFDAHPNSNDSQLLAQGAKLKQRAEAATSKLTSKWQQLNTESKKLTDLVKQLYQQLGRGHSIDAETKQLEQSFEHLRRLLVANNSTNLQPLANHQNSTLLVAYTIKYQEIAKEVGTHLFLLQQTTKIQIANYLAVAEQGMKAVNFPDVVLINRRLYQERSQLLQVLVNIIERQTA